MGEREKMSNQEAPFSYTVKINNQNLFTVRGDDFDSFLGNLVKAGKVPDVALLLDFLEGKQHEEALSVVQQVFANSTVVETATAPTGVPQTQTFAPVPPPATGAPAPANSGQAPTCSHGTKSAKKGNGAKGEWKAWMCPAPKGTPDQCPPAWVTKATADWNNFPA